MKTSKYWLLTTPNFFFVSSGYDKRHHQTKVERPKLARWTVLFIVAFTMMMGYFITYEMSPLESILESSVGKGMGWTSSEYGFVSGSYGFINGFADALFGVGIILDKMGVRFTGILSCSLMVLGAAINFYALQFVSPDNSTFINIPCRVWHIHTSRFRSSRPLWDFQFSE